MSYTETIEALQKEVEQLREALATHIGPEDPVRSMQRAEAISHALGIKDQSTTKQIEAIEALKAKALKNET